MALTLTFTELPLWWTDNYFAYVYFNQFYPANELSDPEPVYDGYAYTLTAEDLPTLTADGYKHTGWTLTDGTPVSVGDTITADTELVAVWEEASSGPSIDREFWQFAAIGFFCKTTLWNKE